MEQEREMHLYDRQVLVSTEEVELHLRWFPKLAWLDFLMNPRRLRGSDFLMRWSQGQWSEERQVNAVNENGKFYAIAYGPSGTAPDDP